MVPMARLAIWVSVCKAALTRLLFATHVVAVIYLVVVFKGDSTYYLLCLATLAQIAEGVFTMLWNKGGEWKW